MGHILAGPRRRLVKIVDQVLDSLQDPAACLGWATELGGAMCPVEPVRGIALSVKSGQLPPDLSGVYLRVGPNMQHWPPKKRTHVFDGDGMIHSVRIAGGAATYSCDYVQTPRFKVEQERGDEWFIRIGEMHGKAGLAKILTVMRHKAAMYGLREWETSAANTAIGYTPDGKLWATNEVGPPFRFRLDEDGAISSIGFDTLKATHEMPVSAHPKFDQRTGEIFFHGKEMMPARFFAGRVVDGQIVDRCDLDMPRGFNHDMFMTENFVCMISGSMRFSPRRVVDGKPLWTFDPKAKLQFAIFPRSAGKMTPDKWIWIDAPVAAEIVHMLYAYDEGGKIFLWTPLQFYEKGSPGQILGDGGPFKMHRLVIDVDRQSVDCQMVPGAEPFQTEFPRIRDDRVGLRCRYGFSGIQVLPPDFNFRGILKWDFAENRLCGEIHFPKGVVGGEPVLFPREGGAPDEAGDDGYVGMFLWNTEALESTFAIFDARSFSATPVVELAVPRRVPLGFHAAYLTEDQLRQHLTAH